jgi:hypothetical protein
MTPEGGGVVPPVPRPRQLGVGQHERYRTRAAAPPLAHRLTRPPASADAGGTTPLVGH